MEQILNVFVVFFHTLIYKKAASTEAAFSHRKKISLVVAVYLAKLTARVSRMTVILI